MSDSEWKEGEALQQKAQEVDRLLFEHYGGPFHFFSTKDPVSELVSALLSHRTRNSVSGQAYRNLRERYPRWERVISASTTEIERAISMVTFPEVKAPRIQQALQYISDHNNGKISLDFLRDQEVKEIRIWLEQIPGVGSKTSAATLNFSHWRLPALVVDMHHLRVAQRVGLVPGKATLKKGAAILESYLPEGWDGQRVYDNHQAYMRHGQRVCHWKSPDCSACVIRHLCDYYQKTRIEKP